MNKIKKLTITLLGALVLTGCSTFDGQATFKNKANTTTYALTDILLSGNKTKPVLKMVRKLNQADNELNNVLDILKQVDTLLSENRNNFSSNVETLLEGDYKTKETITYIDQNNSKKTIELLYNSQTINEVDEDEKETKTINKGILLSDGAAYNFVSENEIEEEKYEKENSNKIKIETGINSYIVCEQSFEEEIKKDVTIKEEKYEYKIVENNKTLNEYSISFETGKDNLTEIELEINDIEYEVKEFSKDNKQYLSLEVENSDDEKEYLYEISINDNGEKTYTLI